jgi:hypothetical protein
VSAYYYTGAVGIFVGVLFALALFLFTYGGYEGVVADRVVGSLAGAAALGVILFPTSAPGCLSEPSWWHRGFRVVHHVSAVALFVAFILLAIWLFRNPDPRISELQRSLSLLVAVGERRESRARSVLRARRTGSVSWSQSKEAAAIGTGVPRRRRREPTAEAWGRAGVRVSRWPAAPFRTARRHPVLEPGRA